MITGALSGARCLTEGRRLVRQPGIRRYVWIPLGVALIQFSLASWFSISWLNGWIHGLDFDPGLTGAWAWLEPVAAALGSGLKWLLIICGSLLVLFTAGQIGTLTTQLLAAPFLGQLALRVEGSLRAAPVVEETFAALVARTVRREVHKLGYWLWRILAVGALSGVFWMLGLGLVTTVVWYLFGAWMMSAQYLDIVADNHGLAFDEVLATMRKHRAAALGFGGGIVLVTSIPLLNLFIVPVAVAGAVAFWVKVR